MGLELIADAKKPLDKVGNFYKHAFIQKEKTYKSTINPTFNYKEYKHTSALGRFAIFPLKAFHKADAEFKDKNTSKLDKFRLFMLMLLATPPLIIGFAVTLLLAIIAAVALAAAATVVVPVAGLLQLGQFIKNECCNKGHQTRFTG